MSDNDFETRVQERKDQQKAKAKELRRAAYLKAKNSPSALAHKAKVKELRRAANERIKALRKNAAAARKQDLQRERDQAKEERAHDLLRSLKTGNQDPVSPPKLRLILGGNSD